MLLGNVLCRRAGAGWLCGAGRHTAGVTLLALVIYANRVFEPVMQLSGFYNMFRSAMSALEAVVVLG